MLQDPHIIQSNVAGFVFESFGLVESNGLPQILGIVILLIIVIIHNMLKIGFFQGLFDVLFDGSKEDVFTKALCDTQTNEREWTLFLR